MTRSVVAMVNGQPWDMHRPLTEDCEIEFLHFKDENPEVSNQVRTRFLSFPTFSMFNLTSHGFKITSCKIIFCVSCLENFQHF